MKNFPNGFTSWQETHFEVVSHIVTNEHIVDKLRSDGGIGSLYELAEELTDEFEKLHENNTWVEGNFHEVLEEFLKTVK